MVVLIASLLLLVALAILFRTAFGPPDHSRRSLEPRCARCAYIVRGIPTLTCPECGSDLREVGITTGTTRQSPWNPFLIVTILWSLALFLTTVLIFEANRHAIPRRGTANHVVTLTAPRSNAFQSITIDASGHYRTGTRGAAEPFEPAGFAHLFLNDGGIASLNVDVARGTYAYRAPGAAEVTATGEIDGKLILSWMTDAGVDTTVAGVTREAAEIAAHLRAPPPDRSSHSYSSSTSSGPFGSFASGSENWSARPSGIPWGDIFPPAFGLIAWLAGLRWIARRFRIIPDRARGT